MNVNNLLQMLLFIVVLLVVVVLVVCYLSVVMDGSLCVVCVFGLFECVLYCVVGVDVGIEMNWKQYVVVMIVFNVFGVLFFYGLLCLQGFLFGNLQQFGVMMFDGVFNMVVSFVVNMNWQDYVFEQIVSYLLQMFGLMVQNFLLVVIGIVVVIVLICGFVCYIVQMIGNFWVDFMCVMLYVFVLMVVFVVVLLMSQGVLQNMKVYQDVLVLQVSIYVVLKFDVQGNLVKDDKGNVVMVLILFMKQMFVMGLVVLQEVIKMFGINGGGFFNVNFVYLYENLMLFVNFIEIFVILIILVVLCLVFGCMIGDCWQGVVVFVVMMVVFMIVIGVEVSVEQVGNLMFVVLYVDQLVGVLQLGGNMEGKEMCFGIVQIGIFMVVIMVVLCGVVDVMYDLLMLIGGFVLMLLMQFGEVVYGGVGLGFYGMFVFVLFVVFVVGLMIGCMLEYVGKKIELYEMKMVLIVVLFMLLFVLVGMLIVVFVDVGKVGIVNFGLYGFLEIFYVFSLVVNNNGSVFVGLMVSMLFYNWMIVIVMWFGCFGMIVLVLVIVGFFVVKKCIVVMSGMLLIYGLLFVVLLFGIVLLVGVLIYVLVFVFGLGVEYLMMWLGV